MFFTRNEVVKAGENKMNLSNETIGCTGDIILMDATHYQRLVRNLMYATITRPDISYVVQTLNQFIQMPKRSHIEAT